MSTPALAPVVPNEPLSITDPPTPHHAINLSETIEPLDIPWGEPIHNEKRTLIAKITLTGNGYITTTAPICEEAPAQCHIAYEPWQEYGRWDTLTLYEWESNGLKGLVPPWNGAPPPEPSLHQWRVDEGGQAYLDTYAVEGIDYGGLMPGGGYEVAGEEERALVLP